MKLVLTGTINKLGIAGGIAEVHDGYGRNYLVPQGKAIVWSRGTERRIEGIGQAHDTRGVRGVEYAQKLHTQIGGLTVEVPAYTAGSGSLFGAVTVASLTLAAKKAGGLVVGKWSVSFAGPVKTAGNHVASVKLHPAITARVDLEVILT